MAAKKKRPLPGTQQIKRARAEREERELYERYRDNPERQLVAPAFVQLARKGGDKARRAKPVGGES